MDKVILKKFLDAGYFDKGTWYPTLQGTPQGSPLSPTLSVMTLSGLEKRLKELFKENSKVHAVVYADDFIVSGASKELLEMIVKPVISKFLKERGLELSEEKTKITHINEGFDFLGFHVRKYPNGKFLTKPSKENVKKFIGDLRKIVKVNVAAETHSLIYVLNQKIRGWANYYRHATSSRIFNKVDNEVYLALERWMKKRHPRKGWNWMNRKYFRQDGLRRWQFFATVKERDKTRILRLVKASSIPIRRFPKIKGAAHPFHPEYQAYFAERAMMKRQRFGPQSEPAHNSSTGRTLRTVL